MRVPLESTNTLALPCPLLVVLLPAIASELLTVANAPWTANCAGGVEELQQGVAELWWGPAAP